MIVEYSSEEKRKIILDNFNDPVQQIELKKLKEVSKNFQIPFFTFRSLDSNCGDTFYLLVKREKNDIKECFFSAQQSCLIVVSLANIICLCLKEKKTQFAWKIIKNCQKMIEKKKYNLDYCPKLKIFGDIFQFPHRIGCMKLVIRGFSDTLSS